MKKFTIINLFLAFVLILGSCATNNNVVSNRLISKRKYTKGFHINKKSHLKSDNDEDVAKNVENEEENTVAFEPTKKEVKRVVKESFASNESTQEETYAANTTSRESSPSMDSPFETSDDRRVVSNEERTENRNESSNNEVKAKQTEMKKISKMQARGSGNTTLLEIILIVLLVCAIIALLNLLGGPFGWIISVVVLAVIIWLLLRLLGVI